MQRFIFFVSLLLLYIGISFPLQGKEEECCYCRKETPHHLLAAPQFYYVRRLKMGGTHQKGFLYGIQGSYDYIKRFSFYCGVEGSYAKGEMKGKTAMGDSLLSDLIDMEVEGRIGYTFQWCNPYCPTLIPYIGYGYFCQKNTFRSPSPLPLHFRDTLEYASFGFFSSIFPSPCLKIGFNFKAKHVLEAKSKVTHDPEFPEAVMNIGEKMQYTVEFPLFPQIPWLKREVNIGIIPFFHYAMMSGTAIGGLVSALRWGIFKGIQATEAGIGTQTIPHSMAQTEDPNTQGALAMLSTYSAGFVSFLSGVVALITNTWQDPTLPLGISMVAASFQLYFSSVGIVIVAISALLFALGTILGNSYNGSECFRYLMQNRKVYLYYVGTACVIFISTICEAKMIWSIVDIILACMALPHMAALILAVCKPSKSNIQWQDAPHS